MANRSLFILIAAASATAITACGGNRAVNSAEEAALQAAREGSRDDSGPIIGVNTFLWRATLETIDFMPLQSADPYGGVVVTDWYVNPEQPSERFKATVFILDSRLRADGLKVNVFRQVFDQDRGWIDQPANPATSLEIENAILTSARELKIATLD